MRTDCNTIRREIDEANLDDQFTLEVNEHLSNCDQCRRFHDDQRTLRGLMAELDTVGAPADFDFRLRARLAREQPGNGFAGLLRTARPIAALSLLVLIGIMLVVVKSRISAVNNSAAGNKPAAAPGSSVATTEPGATVPKQISVAKDPSPTKEVKASESPRPAPGKREDASERDAIAQNELNRARGNVSGFHTRDSAGMGAEVVTPQSLGGLVVVPVDGREFKLSIDNGRGVARTISLPPVTFGSQRLLAREASYVPASTTRGDW